MDIFALRDRVVGEYRDYLESFINIYDPAIEQFVRQRLEAGDLWPDAVLQLNPAFVDGPTLRELAGAGVIARETARLFGEELRLYQHQAEALEAAQRGEHYVVSTGTGSGKSLTYLIPIVDRVFRDQPGRHSVRAIIVYPMNALVNSQFEALTRFRERNWPDCPLRFARYTGQERGEGRNQILRDPPHVLLTNYVMLEYMLIRPQERTLLQLATRELRFLVLDELHVYRGRQGADVAMLMRRVRQRAVSDSLQFVGTSATLATEGSRDQRRLRIAETASALFGVTIPPANVVDESLRRMTTVQTPSTRGEVRAAVEAAPPDHSAGLVTAHPLAAWVEERFGLDIEDGRLVRRAPATFEKELEHLQRESGLGKGLCRDRLKAILAAGNEARRHSGDPVFAFRLHQFLGSGSSVFATLEHAESRHLTMEGQFVAPGSDEGPSRLLYPLAFCRECGQEYYVVSREQSGLDHLDGSGENLDNVVRQRLTPRSPVLDAPDGETAGRAGFFALDLDGIWSEEDTLPEYWSEERKNGARLRAGYAGHVPVRYWARPDGSLLSEETPGAIAGWFQPRPLLLCLRCRAAYDLRQRSDFAKLSTLSQIGRSTATTTTVGSTAIALDDEGVEPAAQKVLSFTDNRQDASLQAGHLNDFTQVALLRGAVRLAIDQRGTLTFAGLGQAIFDAMALRPKEFMREPRDSGPGFDKAVAAMRDLLEFRAYEDLRRAWRVAQPNLEQCGLLRIDYDGLAKLAGDGDLWAGVPAIGEVGAVRRESVLGVLLDHLRFALAIDTPALAEEEANKLKQRTAEWLCDPWAMDEQERPRLSGVALLPGVAEPPRWKGAILRLGPLSSVGRYLRSPRTWNRTVRLEDPELEALVGAIVAALRGHILTVLQHGGGDFGVQLKAGALRWVAGDGRQPGPDPVRARSLHLRKTEVQSSDPNRYFTRLYQTGARRLAGVVGREHTGQVAMDVRMEREEDFRQGKIKALFCSPTMELGVDIADLFAVHMRNVPPTAANYAQRSGRAGRGGRAALVLTFCSQGNAHDEYFFRRKERMIAGAVAPARFDLSNRELIQGHLHSVWLSLLGLDLGRSMAELLDLDDPAFPIQADKAAQLNLSDDRQRAIREAFRIVANDGASLAGATWLTDEWIADTVRQAPARLESALRTWRDLYRAALTQRDAARRVIDRPRAPSADRKRAEQQEQEAKREITLLLNEGEITESDFYPYRYLASEGFLPGYNFPRLPLRVLVAAGKQAQSIERPRFLGLTEFGPQNIIYHEGRKHRVASCILPVGGIEDRLIRARICNNCGCIYPGDAAARDLCDHCRSTLDAATSEYPQHLFDQPSVRAVRTTRITSDEEDRSRRGYVVTTHVRFSDSQNVQRAEVRAGERQLLEATYAPQTELWRINHGWRGEGQAAGFVLERESGRWGKSNDDPDDGERDPAAKQPLTGVKPYVTDRRNVLLLRPPAQAAQDQAFMVTLAYALQRAIQFVYQVEEQEVAVELIGKAEHQRLLLWEAAEGGTGVWERLFNDPDSVRVIAEEALRLCHFDANTGDSDPAWEHRCAAACYDCLLSYSNQRLHRYLDRRLIKDYLLALKAAVLMPVTAGRDYDAHYSWLLERTDPASDLERELLDYLHARRLRLPDLAQHQPAPDVAVQPDFFYQRDGLPGACVFVDGPHHEGNQQRERDRSAREALEDRGFRVVVVRYDRTMDEQVAAYPDLFGTS